MATEIASLFARISADTSDFTSKMASSHNALTTLEGGLNSVAKVAAVAMGIGVAAVGGLAIGIGQSIMAAAEMEQNLANITAAMGLTSAETTQLKTLISDLGLDPKLKVSATEAAAAIEMLGKNGLTVDEILQGAARSTVLLANATGGDLALAADVTTSMMQAFGVKVEDVDDVVNSISGSLVASKFNLNDYALAMAQGGGVAAAVGVEYEDFNTAIAAVSPLFASGSDAGTSYKTMLMRLTPQSNAAADMMRELGLYTGLTADEMNDAKKKSQSLADTLGDLEEELASNTERMANLEKQMKVLNSEGVFDHPALRNMNNEYAQLYKRNVEIQKELEDTRQEQTALNATMVKGQNAFYDSNGMLKDQAQIAGILQEATRDLTEEQKANALGVIFGNDGMRAAIGLANTGEQGFIDLKTAIGNTDAEEQAAIRMNTLSGKIETLRGVIEAITQKIGDKFMPAAQKIADWALKMITEHEPQIDKFFGTLAEKVVEAVETFVKNWPMIQKSLEEGWKVVKEVLPDIGKLFEKLSDWFTSTDSKRPLEWLARFIASGAVTFEAMGDLVGGVIEGFKLLGDAFKAALRLDFGEVGNLSKKAWDAFSDAGMSGAEMDKAVEDMMKRIYGDGKALGGYAGGMTLVGENGPELVDLPRGSYVHPNSESQGMMRGTSITIQNLTMQGTGNSGQDLASAVTFLNSMYSYGY